MIRSMTEAWWFWPLFALACAFAAMGAEHAVMTRRAADAWREGYDAGHEDGLACADDWHWEPGAVPAPRPEDRIIGDALAGRDGPPTLTGLTEPLAIALHPDLTREPGDEWADQLRAMPHIPGDPADPPRTARAPVCSPGGKGEGPGRQHRPASADRKPFPSQGSMQAAAGAVPARAQAAGKPGSDISAGHGPGNQEVSRGDGQAPERGPVRVRQGPLPQPEDRSAGREAARADTARLPVRRVLAPDIGDSAPHRASAARYGPRLTPAQRRRDRHKRRGAWAPPDLARVARLAADFGVVDAAARDFWAQLGNQVASAYDQLGQWAAA